MPSAAACGPCSPTWITPARRCWPKSSSTCRAGCSGKCPIRWRISPPGGTSWLQHRQRLGALQRVPRDFYAGIWDLLHHCRGLVIGDKLERRNRLESEPLLSEKTRGERNFASLVEHLLIKIEAPEYRQLCTETLLSLVAFVGANPQVRFDDYLALDVVIGYAVRAGWAQTHPHQPIEAYAQHKASALDLFYRSSPATCRRWQMLALRDLAEIRPAPAQMGTSSAMQSAG